MMRRPLALLALLVLASCFGVERAHAAAEVFTSFDVQFQEEDDESLLDHFLTRAPREWRYEWERSPSAIRTSQGCLTSGQWFIDTDLKLVTALGDKAVRRRTLLRPGPCGDGAMAHGAKRVWLSGEREDYLHNPVIRRCRIGHSPDG